VVIDVGSQLRLVLGERGGREAPVSAEVVQLNPIEPWSKRGVPE
jgi:hypothetical protein